MDLNLDENQQALAELARKILTDKLPADHLTKLEGAGETVDRGAWSDLAEAGLLGVGLAEDVGGAGMSIFETCLVLEEIGRTVAPLPYLATIVMGAMTIDRFGSPAQRESVLPGVVAGSTFLTAAIAESGNDWAPEQPATKAERANGDWRLSGEKLFVPSADIASTCLVSASSAPNESSFFLIDPRGAGTTIERMDPTTREAEFVIRFDDALVTDAAILGKPGQGAEITPWLTQHATAGVCAMQAGVCEEAVRMTGTHVSEREQFGSKIATFQAVAQRAADAYIDTAAISLTARYAAWSLARGDAALELDIAKFWAADGGKRVAHAAQHLHGGIGVDTDYPLFRYFRKARHLELTLGGATERALAIGDQLADGGDVR